MQQIKTVLHQSQSEQRAEQTEPEAAPEKRPSYECVARADEFGHFDLVAAVLDLQANRVADDDNDRETKQAGADHYGPLHDFQYCMKALNPFGIDLHDVGLGQAREFLSQQNHRLRRIRGARPDDERMRQRVLRQVIERVTESRLLFEFFQRIVGRDQLHVRDVGTLPDQASDALCFADSQACIEKHGKVERVIPAAADGCEVLDDKVHCGRQRQGNGDNENDHQARKRLVYQPSERTRCRARVSRQPDGDRPRRPHGRYGV